MTIHNDIEFKQVLNGLGRTQQRVVAARFAGNVMGLSRDSRVKYAVESGKRSDMSDDDLNATFQSAKAASVESFTQCGHECDWTSQAGHFAAKAALACVSQSDLAVNAAWEAAMHARMARTCQGIATGQGTENAEVEAQYRILSDFLKD